MPSSNIYKLQPQISCVFCQKTFYKIISFKDHTCKQPKFNKVSFNSCSICNKIYSNPNIKTCGNRSCVISFGNKGKIKSKPVKNKIATTLISNNETLFDKNSKDANGKTIIPISIKYYRKNLIKFPYSPIFINQCKHCEYLYCSQSKEKFCAKCLNKYHRSKRDAFKFTFTIENYPELFDLTIIKKIGWFHHTKNKDGLSRDHKISINNAIKFNYDRFYIKHPLNCEIMTQRKNSSKGAFSSLTYEELVQKVDTYELLKIVTSKGGTRTPIRFPDCA